MTNPTNMCGVPEPGNTGLVCCYDRGHGNDPNSLLSFHSWYTVPRTLINAVDHPIHYGGDVPHEHWKCAVAWGLDKNAFLYTCTKYICRVGKKGDALEDLKKAKWYLDKAIEQLNRGNNPGENGFHRVAGGPHHERCDAPTGSHTICRWEVS